jgi:aminomethyltransferase
MVDQGIPRPSYEICNDRKEKIGHLTSGTFSPLLRIGVGMGYIDASQPVEPSAVLVRIRDRWVRAKIAPFPLYNPDEYGYKRKTAD